MNAPQVKPSNTDGRHRLDKQIISVAALLAETGIRIPEYQRPYKWTPRHLNQLASDIKLFSDKPSYRLGTVVLHAHQRQLDIVDGQQRFLSLLLLVKAISELRGKVASPALAQQLQQLARSINKFASKQQFASAISTANLRANLVEARRIVARPDFTEHHIRFLLNQCELITVVLDDISEAFQFFDSQNSRGRDLAPHDLLKAYHLREFVEEALKQQTVEAWEARESDELAALFGLYLYRIRRWSEGLSALEFTKGDIDTFKGVSLHKQPLPPYARALQLVEASAGEAYPFQLTQTIPNGRRFFEYVGHYLTEQAKLVTRRQPAATAPVEMFGVVLTPQARHIVHTITSYKERHRTGDQYVRNLFDCALLLYVDKFGTAELSNAIEKIFIWAYRLRLELYAVKQLSVDNYAKDGPMFKTLRLATRPSDVLNVAIAPLSANQANGVASDMGKESLPELVSLFRELGCYE